MIELLTICNTAMTFGILVGVWIGVFKTDSELQKTDSELKDAIYKINRFLRDKIGGLTGEK